MARPSPLGRRPGHFARLGHRDRLGHVPAAVSRSGTIGDRGRAPAPGHDRWWRSLRIVRIVAETSQVVAAGLLLVVLTAPDASAITAAGPPLAVQSIDGVINGLRVWIVSILVGLATLFLTIGGLRYLLAGGDPGEVEKAKSALRSAAIGYALAVMAPVFVQILRQILGT